MKKSAAVVYDQLLWNIGGMLVHVSGTCDARWDPADELLPALWQMLTRPGALTALLQLELVQQRLGGKYRDTYDVLLMVY